MRSPDLCDSFLFSASARKYINIECYTLPLVPSTIREVQVILRIILMRQRRQFTQRTFQSQGLRIQAPEEELHRLRLTPLWSTVLCARHGPPAAMITQRSPAQDWVHYFSVIQGWRTYKALSPLLKSHRKLTLLGEGSR